MATQSTNLNNTDARWKDRLMFGDDKDILAANGWFYHAPSKPKVNAKPVEVPPQSQIPGLAGNDFPYNPLEEPKKMVIKESDSAYVRMAKMGGRPELLRMRTPKGPSKEAKSYPRNDWFYLEDNRIEDEQQKFKEQESAQHEFTLPDYMVHQAYQPHGDEPDQHPLSRNPLAKDTSTVYQREGVSATDKTVRIQEHRPSGYGIRQEKQKDRKPKMPQTQMPERPKARQGELEMARTVARPPLPKPKEEERPLMSKILAFSYAKEDEMERQKWQHEQEVMKQNAREQQQRQDKVETEYQSRINNSSGKKPRVPSHGRRAGSGQVSEAGSRLSQRSQFARRKQQDEKEKPDFFKLSKFENVPSKVNSHRSADEIQPMSYNPTRDLSDLQIQQQKAAAY